MSLSVTTLASTPALAEPFIYRAYEKGQVIVAEDNPTTDANESERIVLPSTHVIRPREYVEENLTTHAQLDQCAVDLKKCYREQQPPAARIGTVTWISIVTAAAAAGFAIGVGR